MTWNITDRFPNWGETGESPPDGFFYDGQDQVNEKHLDYLWNSVKGLEDDVQSALNDIDNDSDGVVDRADTLVDFDEKTEDTVAAILQEGDKVSITHDDANDTLTVDTSALDTEEVGDAVASLVAANSNLSWSYDDPNDTLTVSLSDSISVNTLEAKDTFTDPSGAAHTTKLAEISDLVDDHGDLKNVTPDQHHARYTDGEAKSVVYESDPSNYTIFKRSVSDSGGTTVFNTQRDIVGGTVVYPNGNDASKFDVRINGNSYNAGNVSWADGGLTPLPPVSNASSLEIVNTSDFAFAMGYYVVTK
jgi:hypothetical protein